MSRRPRSAVVFICVAAILGLSAGDLRAQEPQTRAEALRAQREQKAMALEPYKPSGIERLLLWLENNRSWERLLNPAEGVYPKIGTITPGGGIGFGAGYRDPVVFSESVAFSTVAIASFARYWLIDARLTLTDAAGGRVFGGAYARAYDHPSEAFFGIGPASRRDAQSYFGLRNTLVGAAGGVHLGASGSIGAGLEYLTPSIDRGRRSPAVQDRFTADTPGLERQPDFTHYSAFAELNTREPRGNPRVGGLYRIGYDRYSDRDFGAYSFGRTTADLQQYFSVFNQRRVIALHALVSSATPDSGQVVPFYLQETLGGPDDLRGFRRHRFRDRHLLLLQAEYRWEVFTAMDAALFVDAGKVASRREDLDFKRLEHDYGFGVRFGTDNGVFLRIEGAYGSRDGKHFVFRFGDVF